MAFGQPETVAAEMLERLAALSHHRGTEQIPFLCRRLKKDSEALRTCDVASYHFFQAACHAILGELEDALHSAQLSIKLSSNANVKVNAIKLISDIGFIAEAGEAAKTINIEGVRSDAVVSIAHSCAIAGYTEQAQLALAYADKVADKQLYWTQSDFNKYIATQQCIDIYQQQGINFLTAGPFWKSISKLLTNYQISLYQRQIMVSLYFYEPPGILSMEIIDFGNLNEDKEFEISCALASDLAHVDIPVELNRIFTLDIFSGESVQLRYGGDYVEEV